jgi:hypothetical protein
LKPFGHPAPIGNLIAIEKENELDVGLQVKPTDIARGLMPKSNPFIISLGVWGINGIQALRIESEFDERAVGVGRVGVFQQTSIFRLSIKKMIGDWDYDLIREPLRLGNALVDESKIIRAVTDDGANAKHAAP